MPDPARECARLILALIGDLLANIKAIEKATVVRHKANDMSQRLATIPGAGIITATAMVATVIDDCSFWAPRWCAMCATSPT